MLVTCQITMKKSGGDVLSTKFGIRHRSKALDPKVPLFQDSDSGALGPESGTRIQDAQASMFIPNVFLS